jgi:hypothetical protein
MFISPFATNFPHTDLLCETGYAQSTILSGCGMYAGSCCLYSEPLHTEWPPTPDESGKIGSLWPPDSEASATFFRKKAGRKEEEQLSEQITPRSFSSLLILFPLPAGGKIHGQISGPEACRFHCFGSARTGDDITFEKKG